MPGAFRRDHSKSLEELEASLPGDYQTIKNLITVELIPKLRDLEENPPDKKKLALVKTKEETVSAINKLQDSLLELGLKKEGQQELLFKLNNLAFSIRAVGLKPAEQIEKIMSLLEEINLFFKTK